MRIELEFLAINRSNLFLWASMSCSVWLCYVKFTTYQTFKKSISMFISSYLFPFFINNYSNDSTTGALANHALPTSYWFFFHLLLLPVFICCLVISLLIWTSRTDIHVKFRCQIKQLLLFLLLQNFWREVHLFQMLWRLCILLHIGHMLVQLISTWSSLKAS